IVVAGGALVEAQRVLPDRPGAEAGAGHERRALVGGGAHDGDVGVELAQVGADRGSQEGGDADERHVQPPGAVLVVMRRTLGHLPSRDEACAASGSLYGRHRTSVNRRLDSAVSRPWNTGDDAVRRRRAIEEEERSMALSVFMSEMSWLD